MIRFTVHPLHAVSRQSNTMQMLLPIALTHVIVVTLSDERVHLRRHAGRPAAVATLHLVFRATYAPHHAPKNGRTLFAGQFDDGWDSVPGEGAIIDPEQKDILVSVSHSRLTPSCRVTDPDVPDRACAASRKPADIYKPVAGGLRRLPVTDTEQSRSGD